MGTKECDAGRAEIPGLRRFTTGPRPRWARGPRPRQDIREQNSIDGRLVPTIRAAGRSPQGSHLAGGNLDPPRLRARRAASRDRPPDAPSCARSTRTSQSLCVGPRCRSNFGRPHRSLQRQRPSWNGTHSSDAVGGARLASGRGQRTDRKVGRDRFGGRSRRPGGRLVLAGARDRFGVRTDALMRIAENEVVFGRPADATRTYQAVARSIAESPSRPARDPRRRPDRQPDRLRPVRRRPRLDRPLRQPGEPADRPLGRRRIPGPPRPGRLGPGVDRAGILARAAVAPLS